MHPNCRCNQRSNPSPHRPRRCAAGLKAQNPAVQAVPDTPPEFPLKHVAGSLDSFVCALVENMEEMTPSQKEDAGACLQMAFGDWLLTHEKARIIVGCAGLLGIYGGRIKAARKITKVQKEKKEKETKRQGAGTKGP